MKRVRATSQSKASWCWTVIGHYYKKTSIGTMQAGDSRWSAISEAARQDLPIRVSLVAEQ
jgi:hypothetical protein